MVGVYISESNMAIYPGIYYIPVWVIINPWDILFCWDLLHPYISSMGNVILIGIYTVFGINFFP